MSDSGSVTEDPIITQQEFKEAVKEWVSINDEIAEMRKVINAKNKRKNKMNEVIIAFMQQNDKAVCNLGTNGTLQMKTQKSTLALKRDQIEELLLKLNTDAKFAKETADFLNQNRTVREKAVLKRSTVVID